MDTETFEIHYIGKYRPAPKSRAFNKAFWTSDVVRNGQTHRIVDAAGINDNGQNIVNLIPYGPNSRTVDDIVADGDLIAYIRERNIIKLALNPDILLPLCKGRASHAELCYREDGRARHISLWDAPNPVYPTDCKNFHDRADNAALGIFRISLKEYNIDLQREDALKREVRRWKTIVGPVNFPNGFSLNFDPVDFTDTNALAEIAKHFLEHTPSDCRSPVSFKMNCVQWSTLVLSLAFCFPLTRKVVLELGVQSAFETNWMSRVNGYAEDHLVGMDTLPIPFYTPMEVVENAVDMYLGDIKKHVMDFADHCPAELLLNSQGLRMDQQVIMPSAFIIENRLRQLGVKRKTKTIFEYVATALPEGELMEQNNEMP